MLGGAEKIWREFPRHITEINMETCLVCLSEHLQFYLHSSGLQIAACLKMPRILYGCSKL